MSITGVPRMAPGNVPGLAHLVGASGFEPAIPTTRIVVPNWIAEALNAAA
jgi:hypothetical protein